MSKATLKFIRLSPNKARLIAREVQGMNAEHALASLEFAPNKAAGIISKVIASAVANGDYEPEEVVVLSCRVDKGPVLKRFRPRARGSASRILKPTSHIMVEVGVAGSDADVTSSKKKSTKAEASKTVKKTDTKKATKKKADSKKSDAKLSTDEADKKSSAKPATKAKTETKAKKDSSIVDLSDMSHLSGIGPVMAKKLEAEGITSIRDIAEMTKEDIAALDAKLSTKGDIQETCLKAASVVLKNYKKSLDANDLKQLYGVGVAVEKKLKAEGITTIAQIAEMSQDELAAIDEKLAIKGDIKSIWPEDAKKILKNNKKES